MVAGMGAPFVVVGGGSGAHATVDVDRRAGDVSAGVGGEEAHAGGDLVRRAGAAGGDGVDDLAGYVGRHVGVDEAGGDGVDRHAAAGDLGRDRLGQPDQAGLGRGIVGLPGVGARAD